MFWLKLIVGMAAPAILIVFFFHFLRLRQWRKVFPEPLPRGSQKRGMIYALSRGLMPWEKESTRRHFLVYLTGIIYHSAIFAGFAWLILVVASWNLESVARLCLTIILFSGMAAGCGLLLRRLLTPALRTLSTPDDYAANLLVDLFLLTAGASLLDPGFKPLFLGVSFLLILYIPIGKIRHCVFFIPSRLIFGRYFGKRGVLPPSKARV